ncbi:MAG: hypothetical protein LC685_01980 [Actinobacteria bacterium]|nr:hypothetical protein [Actinomycetota bacterium]
MILGILWIAFLVPPLVRNRTEGRPSDSISAFRRQLATLRRTHPVAVRTVPTPRPHAYVASPSPVVASLADRRTLAVTSNGGRPGPRALAAVGLPSARNRTLRRRRDVFIALLGTAAVTLVLGLLPPLHVLLFAHLAVDALLVAYVALLIRQRTVAAEQDMKVRFLPGARPMEPALLRRSVN